MKKGHLLRTAIFTVAMALICSTAHGGSSQEDQTQEPEGLTVAHTDSSQEDKAQQLEGLTVTAQKTEENAQRVPISMDVFSDMAMEDAKIENTFDLTRFAPNVFMKNRYVEHIVVIRGMSSFKGCNYSPAGFYVDDVSYPLHYMQNIEFFDLERAEVLKGPQGTLYGRNTESGVVNIITRQPGNQLRGKVLAEYGNYNSFRGVANISGPVVRDKLYLGGAFQYRSSDGYVENLYNNNDRAADLRHSAGRATLKWTPAEPWDISLIADFMDLDDHGGGYRFIDGPQATDPFKVRKDTDEYLKQDGNSQILRVKYDGAAVDVISISSALDQHFDKVNDADLWDDPSNEKLEYAKIKLRQYSQEFRVTSQAGPLEWLAGLYGFIEKTDYDYRYDIATKNMTYMNPVTEVDSSGCAAFGQGTYTLFDKLRLTAGIRFDHQGQEGKLNDSVRKITCDKDVSNNEVLPKFSVAYDMTEDAMIYTSASKGYLIGGFNWAMMPTQESFYYDPEYTWNYELGMKTTWLDERLLANLSVFYVSMTDKQVTQMDATRLATTITNAARAHSTGVELQLQAEPVQGLSLSGGFGYTDAQFDDFNAYEWNSTKTGLVRKDYKDNCLPYAPKYTYHVSAQYRGAGGIFARADLLGTGPFYGDAANKAKQEAYETVNVRVGYEMRHFDVYLWVENVFDQDYLTWLSPYNNNTVGLDGPPRTFGTTVTWRF